MAAWINETKLAWKYTSDNGDVYRVNLADYIAGQNSAQVAPNNTAKIGGAAADGTEKRLGGGQKLRRALVTYSAGHQRRMVSVAAPYPWLLQFPPADPADHTLNLNRPGHGDNQPFIYDGLFLTETRLRRAGSAGL